MLAEAAAKATAAAAAAATAETAAAAVLTTNVSEGESGWGQFVDIEAEAGAGSSASSPAGRWVAAHHASPLRVLTRHLTRCYDLSAVAAESLAQPCDSSPALSCAGCPALSCASPRALDQVPATPPSSPAGVSVAAAPMPSTPPGSGPGLSAAAPAPAQSHPAPGKRKDKALTKPSMFYNKCVQGWRRQHEVLPLSRSLSVSLEKVAPSDSLAASPRSLFHHQQQQDKQVETPEDHSLSDDPAELERVLRFLIVMHPRAAQDEAAAERLRRQFSSASPEKQRDVLQAAISTAEKEGRRDLLTQLNSEP